MSRGEVIGVKDERPTEFEHFDTAIPNLGEPKVDSPIKSILLFTRNGELVEKSFVDDAEKILVYDTLEYLEQLPAGTAPLCFELAGPRAKIFFDSSKVHCAIATCGGLCPGTNDVIRAIVLELHHLYNVRHIYGVRYGFQTCCASPPTKWRTFTTMAALSCPPPGGARTSGRSSTPWSA
jgi:hypothetical protein